MAPRTKRTRRILVIAAVAAVAAAAGTWAYLWRQRTLDERALDALARGRAAADAGDARGALDGIGRYLLRFQDRGAAAEDLVRYARARRGVELPENRHVFAAIGSFRKALEIDPSVAGARRELLDLYLEAGYTTEALETLDGLLVESPRDANLLRKKADVLEAVRRFPEALDVSRELNRCAPQDLAELFRTLRLMVRNDLSPSEVTVWIDEVLAAHAGEPRFELIRAAHLTQRGDEAAARECLDRVLAGTREDSDPEFAKILVNQLDAADRFADSLRVLERVAGHGGNDLRRELIRRLWFAGRTADVIERAESWRADAALQDGEILALWIVALEATGRADETAAPRADLEARPGAADRAWRTFVERARPESASPRETCSELAAAASAAPGSAILRQSLGDAYAALGETDLAIATWTEAARRAPAWSLPLRRVARVLLATGRGHLAPSSAHEAVVRSPDDLEAIMVYFEAMAVASGQLDARAGELLRNTVESLLGDGTVSADDFLPLYADLLARTDRAAAEKHLRAALESKSVSSEAALLRLARTAETAGIPLHDAFLDLCESLHGSTPLVALARALSVSRSSGADAGTRVLDEMAARRAQGTSDLDWDLVRATYADSAGVAGAAATWVALADARPGELQVQLGALASSGAWRDRAAIDRIVERVRELSGEEAVTWRIARARWLLEEPAASHDDVAAAAKIVGDVVRVVPRSTPARRLLARALEMLGNVDGAEDQLRAAAEFAPGDTAIALELARLSQRKGQTETARRHVDGVLRAPDLAPIEMERAAYLVAVQGDFRRSADLLEPLTARAEASRDGILLLAQLYARLGETSRALSLCERLLKTPDPAAIELTAHLYAADGRTAEAEATLDLLRAVRLRPGQQESVRARHAASRGDLAAARQWYARAIDAAPEDPSAWSAYLAACVTIGEVSAIDACLADPRSEHADPARFLRELGPLLRPAVADPRLRPMLLAGLDDPLRRPLVADVALAVTESGDDFRSREALAQRIRTLADTNVRVPALQMLAARLAAEVGDRATACEVARRAMSEFPNSPSAARQAAELLAARGSWDEAATAAQTWKDRVRPGDTAPDVLLAEVLTRAGRPIDAASRLDPFIPGAVERPQEHGRMLLAYLTALAAGGRLDRAARVVEDLSARDPAWRTLPFRVDAAQFAGFESAREWYSVAGRAVADDDAVGRLALGKSWASAWEKFGEPDAVARAEACLVPLREVPALREEAGVVLGMLAQRRGDFARAETLYREVLALAPASIVARNNLAMVLTERGEWKAAITEARAALREAPHVAELRDTLACALRRGGQTRDAVAELVAACEAEPAVPERKLHLAETLAEAGETAAAQEWVSRLEDGLRGSTNLSEDFSRRLAVLRTGVR